MEDAEWAEHAARAKDRYDAMMGIIDATPNMVRQGEADRAAFAQEYLIIKDGVPTNIYDPLRALRFMVEICGVPYAAAEEHLLEYERQNASYNFDEKKETGSAARERLAIIKKEIPNIVEAIALARFFNQAFKATPNAKLWNEITRLIRTQPMVPLDTKPEIWDE